MALINCVQCGKQISDKAMVCPNCGCNVDAKVDCIKTKICRECGNELEKDDLVCSNCGCPFEEHEKKSIEQPQQVELTKINISLFKNKKVLISVLAVVVAIILAVICSSIYKKNSAEKYAEEYYNNLESVSTSMLLGASSAEDAGNLIRDVWYNKIYDKYEEETSKYTSGTSDFNEALQKLFADDSFKSKISNIKDNQKLVNDLMRDLKNPPEKYVDAYEDLKEFHDAYIELTNLVINPTGNLNTYTSNFNNADTKAVNCYEAMQVYFD